MDKKRIFYNMVSGLLYQGVTFILAFLIPRLFLVNFGSEIKGMLSTITQIFSYLWLLEAGVGLATTQALYLPISQKNHASINSIMAATDYYYKKTGYIYLFFVLLFSFGFSWFAHLSLPRWTIFGIVLMQGLPNVISYLFVLKYRLLLEAEGKSYILNNMQMILHFFVNFGKVLVLYCTENIILVQLLPCISIVFQMSFLFFYMKKHYKWLSFSGVIPDFQAIAKKGSALIHQISGVIFNNTDILLLSMMCGFKVSSVYSIYKSFYYYVESFLTTLSSSFTFSLGQMFHVDKKRFQIHQDLYETGYLLVSYILYTLLFLFILPVIRIYTRGVHDINYINPILPILFTVMSLLAHGKLPINQVIIFSEEFHNTKLHAVVEAVLNLSVSAVAIYFWGISGGLCGTIVAIIFRNIVTIQYACKKILHCPVWSVYKKLTANFTVFIFWIVVYWFHSMELTSYGSILVRGILYAFPVSFSYLAVNMIIQPWVVGYCWKILKEKRGK